MITFSQAQTFLLGTAAVIDTALLLALLERRNRPRVIIPMALLVLGAWFFHLGAFAGSLLSGTEEGWARPLHALASLAIAVGLLLMPSALVHGLLRLATRDFAIRQALNWRHALLYLPLLGLIPLTPWILERPTAAFMDIVAPVLPYYLGWIVLVDLVAALGFFLARRRFAPPWARRFLRSVAGLLAVLAVFHGLVFLPGRRIGPEAAQLFDLLASLSPLALALLVAYFIVRYRFMQLVLERSLVYGVLVVGALLFHQVVLQDLWMRLSQEYHVNFALLEGALVVALVVAYQPLRQRVAEALRYLLGSRVDQQRHSLRQLGHDVSLRCGEAPEETTRWFAQSVCEALDLAFVEVWLLRDTQPVQARAGGEGGLTEKQARDLHEALETRPDGSLDARTAPDDRSEEILLKTGANLALRLEREDLSGIVLLGTRESRPELSGEPRNALHLLVEQFAITLYNSRLQAERLAAEHRALQHEKLSSLGLVASSLAHEVKNPLSSIKTITTVLAEELGPDSPHAHDLDLVRAEIDRLAQSINQVLDFARPARADGGHIVLSDALQSTLQIMRHVAARRHVTVTTDCDKDLPPLTGEPNNVREILFNLISNAIEAAGENGSVQVRCRRHEEHILLEIEDDGPGMDPSIRARLFEPFATTRADGTGLGLYVVGRRVRDLGGTIQCCSEEGKGTCFRVQLPLGDEP